MLAALLNVPTNEGEWSRWSFNNYDAVNQIRTAIKSQKGITLPEYQLEPISLDAIDFFLEANQQAHADFTGVLGQQSNDLLHTDLTDPNQRAAWIYLNFFELLNACQTLKIGP